MIAPCRARSQARLFIIGCLCALWLNVVALCEPTAAQQEPVDVSSPPTSSQQREQKARIDAAWKLAEQDKTPDEAVPGLLKMLREEDSEGRAAAAWALGNAGSDAVAGLEKALEQGDLDVRSWAAWALAQIGPEAAEATPALLEHLKKSPSSTEWWHHDGAERLLLHICTAAIENIGPESVPFLVEALQSSQPADRVCAVKSLERLGPRSVSALPNLITSINDQDDDVRRFASLALAAIGRPARTAAPELRMSARNANRPVCPEIALAIVKIQENHEIVENREDVVDVFEKALQHSDPLVRRRGGRCLDRAGDLGPVDPQRAPLVAEWIREREEFNRPPEPREHSSDDNDPAEDVNDPPPAPKPKVELIPQFLESLRTGDVADRFQAIRELKRLGPLAKEAIPELARLLNDEEYELPVTRTMFQIDPESRDALQAVYRIMLDPEADKLKRCWAVACLEERGRKVREAEPYLLELLREQSLVGDDDVLGETTARTLIQIGRVKLGFAYALRFQTDGLGGYLSEPSQCELGPQAAGGVPMLQKALHFKGFPVRSWAAGALGSIGPKAGAAIPELQRLADDDNNEDLWFREECKLALEKISGDK